MEVGGKRLDDDTVSELCAPCQEGNVSTLANGYCNDCEEYMCLTCFQSHVKMRLGRNHVLIAVDAGRKEGSLSHVEKCKKHKTENIKYYCCNHDSVGCGDCLVSYHQKCEFKFIRDLAKNIEESPDFKNILKEVDNLEDLKSEMEISLERNRNDNTEFHDKAIQGILKSRTKINVWLNNVTSHIEEEEMKVWKENQILVSKLEDWIKIINDKINKVRDEISTEKYQGEILFIRVIECKSEINEFASKYVPEIKSSLKIKSFTFVPNQSLLVLTKPANLGVIEVGGRNEDLQTSIQERQNDMTINDKASNVASSNILGTENEHVGVGKRGSVRCSEDPVRVKLEKELEQVKQTTIVEKEKHERLQHSYNALKEEFEYHVSLHSRERDQSRIEREQSILLTKEREQLIVLLQQENNYLKSELNSRIKENEILESRSKARQMQDLNTIEWLQVELKKQSVNHEKESESLSKQIRELQSQMESAEKTYRLPDPRAAGFDVGKQVESTVRFTKGVTGTVTAVDPSGYVDVKWDNGESERWSAGAGGEYWVKLV